MQEANLTMKARFRCKGEVLNSTLRSENPEPAKRERRDRRNGDRRERRGGDRGERRPFNNGERRQNDRKEGGNR